ncbi:hypothetical protein BDB00DRAFT_834925 [Zychaea mexicana]|uniref:uncharacterized protein n=1 Tax=Zychaea mexicana TaxID=64656 RepID=UPI0022FED7D0|nr:uncharacterized protein BDB00DRAFT_834925 [Zychaea mexicana]KAI9491040.1 hypothetical protein BDB00DRAFT_834925 [Zychaea mexicana]
MLRLPCNSCFRTRLVSYSRAAAVFRQYNTPAATDVGPEGSSTICTANTITENDPIHRVNLCVGQIVSVEQHPEANHLFIEQVNVNEEEPRTIVSGLAPYMAKESLLNKRVVVVSNMKPSRFRGVLSSGMLLAASNKDSKAVELLEPSATSQIGERVQVESQHPTGEPDPVLKPKQKIFESVAQSLATDAHKVATYKGYRLVTTNDGGQPIQCKSIAHGQIS